MAANYESSVPVMVNSTGASDTAIGLADAEAHRSIDIAFSATSQAVFWPARHLDRCRNLVHIPFIFWLVETIQPARIVQLGLSDFGGFLSLCQAVDKLNLNTLCFAVDFTPDSTSASSEKTEEMARNYGDFSCLLTNDITGAAKQMHGGEVDLLVIDAPLSDEEITELREYWMPLLSRRAVLVIHEAGERMKSPYAQQFLSEARLTKPVISFPQTRPGLDVILMGDSHPERLQRLAGLKLGMPNYLATRRVFQRLGEGLESEKLLRSQALEIKGTDVFKDRLAAADKALEDERTQKRAAIAAEAEQNAAVAGLQARIFDMEIELRDGIRAQAETRMLSGQLDQLRSELAGALEKCATTEVALTAQNDRAKGLLNARDRARSDAEEKAAEIAALRSTLASAQDEVTRLTAVGARLEIVERERDGALQDATAKAADIELLRSALAEAQNETAARTEALTAAGARLEIVERERDGALQDATAKAADIELLRSALAEARNETAARTEALAAAGARLEIVERERDGALQDATAKAADIELLRSVFAEARNETAARAEELAAAGARLEIVERERDGARQTLTEKTSELVDFARICDALREELAEAQNQRMLGEAALAALTERLGGSENDRDTIQLALTGKAAEIDAARVELAEALDKCTTRERALQAMAERLEASVQKCALLEYNTAQKVAEIAVVTSVSEALRKELQARSEELANVHRERHRAQLDAEGKAEVIAALMSDAQNLRKELIAAKNRAVGERGIAVSWVQRPSNSTV